MLRFDVDQSECSYPPRDNLVFCVGGSVREYKKGTTRKSCASYRNLPRSAGREERMDPVQNTTAEVNPRLESAGSASAIIADGYDAE